MNFGSLKRKIHDNEEQIPHFALSKKLMSPKPEHCFLEIHFFAQL